MKNKLKFMIVIIFLLGVSTLAHADASQWKIDPAHAGIYFSINHIFSKVNGSFQEFEGQIFFDPDKLDESRAVFTVKVKSINTHHSKRDSDLLSDNFFSAKKFPVMRFESTAITHVKGDQYVVDGTMTVKDVSRSIKLPFTLLGTKANPFNPKQEVAGFEARMTLDRLDYNVGNGNFFKMGVVGKDVDVLITIEATR